MPSSFELGCRRGISHLMLFLNLASYKVTILKPSASSGPESLEVKCYHLPEENMHKYFA